MSAHPSGHYDDSLENRTLEDDENGDAADNAKRMFAALGRPRAMKLPDTADLPFPVFVADAGGIIQSTNAAFEGLLPERTHAHWRAAFPDVMPDGGDTQPPPGSHLPVKLTTRAVTSDGESRFYDLYCQNIQHPGHLLGILVDVTDQTHREAEHRAILETAVDAIVVIDESGRIETFNQAASRLLGFAAGDVIGKPVNLLMPEPYRTDHDAYLQHYLTTGEKRIIGIGRELEACHRDGTRIPIYLAVSEIQVGSGRRFAGIIHDLSEQHEARRALADQRERLAHVGRLSIMGEMTASIAHEINQPLTAISMYAQAGLKLIQRGGAAELPRLAETLEKLTTQSLRAGAIIERIQRFSRAGESRREPLDVNALLRELVKLAEADARMHAVQIHFDLKEALPAASGDPIQIQQVALNLIRNAIDAMLGVDSRHGGTLTIGTRAVGERYLEVSVTDQGPGVHGDAAERLFQPFHTTKKDGMGMGLSICRTIIAEHGGDLKYRNNPDAGATFYFTLPIEVTVDD